MTHEDNEVDRLRAHYERAVKRTRSKEDLKQSRLIPESPELDIGV